MTTLHAVTSPLPVLLEIARENVRRAPHLKHRAAERLPGGH
jgi:hypothetical protein